MTESRCRATTHWGRRCRNEVMDVDPRYCHRHSVDHAYERCGVVDRRSGRPCARKAVEHGEPCAGHMPRTSYPKLEEEPLLSGGAPMAEETPVVVIMESAGEEEYNSPEKILSGLTGFSVQGVLDTPTLAYRTATNLHGGNPEIMKRITQAACSLGAL